MSDLTPPDFDRCQAEIREGSFMTLGPRRLVRCDNKPDFLAVELVPGKDGKRGSMTLCLKCAGVMMEIEDFRQRIQLQPVQTVNEPNKD